MTLPPGAGGAPNTTEPGAIVFLPEITEGFTDDEIYRFFSSSGGFVASTAFHLPGQHSQASHGHSGVPRPQLQQAKTIEQIELTTRQELKGITGRNIRVQFTGLEPELAREYGEGVLRGMEHFPHAPLYGIETQDTQAVTGLRTFAHADTTVGIIYFDHTWTRAQIDVELAKGDKTTISPTGHYFAHNSHASTGTHELIHIVHERDANLRSSVHTTLKTYAQRENITITAAQMRISEYAASSLNETMAEAGVDVIYNGGGSEISQLVFANLPGGVTP